MIIFYRFQGLWNTTSTLIDLDAPLGERLFGGEVAYRAALKDFNYSLVYLSKFKALQNGQSINHYLTL